MSKIANTPLMFSSTVPDTGWWIYIVVMTSSQWTVNTFFVLCFWHCCICLKWYDCVYFVNRPAVLMVSYSAGLRWGKILSCFKEHERIIWQSQSITAMFCSYVWFSIPWRLWTHPWSYSPWPGVKAVISSQSNGELPDGPPSLLAAKLHPFRMHDDAHGYERSYVQ